MNYSERKKAAQIENPNARCRTRSKHNKVDALH